MALNIEVKKGK